MCDNRNKFCFICGLLVDQKHRVKLKNNKTLVDGYNDFFKLKYATSDRWYEPEFACTECSLKFKTYKSNSCQKTRISLSSPMIWHHQPYHKPDDCYFCKTNVKGHHYKTRKNIKYADVLTVKKPEVLNDTVNSTAGHEIREVQLVADDQIHLHEGDDEEYIPSGCKSSELHKVSNADFQDLSHDLRLSLRQSEILASRFKQWNLVDNDFRITSSRKDDDRIYFREVFKTDEVNDKLVYCSNVSELFYLLDYYHESNEWRLFIDGSCMSKCFPNIPPLNLEI